MKQNHRRYQFPDGSNYPILESDSKMLMSVTDEDVACATPHDPCECALAQAAMRGGAKKAFIAGTVAYIVMTVKGQEVAIKFSVPAATRRAIKTFDETGTMPTEGFTFGKLHKSQSTEGKRVWNSTRTKEQRRWTGKKSKAAGGETDGDRDLRTFRHLTGQVHTTAE